MKSPHRFRIVQRVALRRNPLLTQLRVDFATPFSTGRYVYLEQLDRPRGQIAREYPAEFQPVLHQRINKIADPATRLEEDILIPAAAQTQQFAEFPRGPMPVPEESRVVTLVKQIPVLPRVPLELIRAEFGHQARVLRPHPIDLLRREALRHVLHSRASVPDGLAHFPPFRLRCGTDRLNLQRETHRSRRGLCDIRDRI